MVISLIHWLLISLSLFFVGWFLNNSFYKKNDHNFFRNTFIGLVVLTAYLQIMSLFFPMKSNVVFIVWLLITFLSIFKYIELKKVIVKTSKASKIPLFLLVGSTAIILLTLYYSTKSVTWYDTYLYHFNMVRWNKYFPVVPGLANLHDRLGFNSSLHIVAAFVEKFAGDGNSAFIINGLIISLVALFYFFTSVNKEERLTVRIFSILTIPYILLRITSIETASLSTDLAIASLSLIFSLELLRLPTNYFILFSIAALLFSIKISGSTALIIVILTIFLKSKQKIKDYLKYSLLGITIILGLLLRNIIISGYPLFPVPFFSFPYYWKLPSIRLSRTLNAIRGWTRMPGPNYLKSLNGGLFFWVGPWWDRIKYLFEIKFFTFSFLLGLVYAKFLKSKLLLAYGFLSIFFLILSAPDLRFGGVYFVITGSVILSDLFMISNRNKSRILNYAVILSIFLITYLVIPNIIIDPLRPPIMNYKYLIRDIKVVPKSLGDDKSKVFFPVMGDQCGNSKIPCTPYKSNTFLSKPNDIGKGFFAK